MSLPARCPWCGASPTRFLAGPGDSIKYECGTTLGTDVKRQNWQEGKLGHWRERSERCKWEVATRAKDKPEQDQGTQTPAKAETGPEA